MATYNPASLGISTKGYGNGAWINGRQLWNGTLSDPGVIHPESNQPGAGQAVSKEVNAQSAANMGMSAAEVEAYLSRERAKQAGMAGGGSGIGYEGGGGGGDGSGVGFSSTRPKIDLSGLFEQYTKEAGISDLESKSAAAQAKIDARRKELADQTALINENPFLAEGNRVGRNRQLTEYAQDDLNNLIAEKTNSDNAVLKAKADVQTKLNIKLQQYNIDSDQYKENLAQFNTLLQQGALDNASASDIANLAVSTGMSTGMIQNAVSASKASKAKPQAITSTDDNGNVTIAVVDLTTGKLINQQSLGQIGGSKSSASGGGGGLTPTQMRSVMGSAASILGDVDSKYRTTNGKVVALSGKGSQKFGGDTYLSQPEYQFAVEKLVAATGLDKYTADEYLTNQAQALGYKQWGTWK